MAKAKTGVLLVNLGTPDSPSVPDVRKYLREFLMDKRVIDIPFISRWLLINFVIAPFRSPKSAKIYQELWEDRGSPLLFHGMDLKDKLVKRLGSDFEVSFGMRYQKPSIAAALDELFAANVKKIIVLPLFPHYASASTGSVIEDVMDIIKGRLVFPELEFITNFPDNEALIQTFAENGKKYMKSLPGNPDSDFDHVVFSYHGLPERQITKSAVDGYCQMNNKCCSTYHSKNQFCYRAQCFQTSRKLAEALGINEDNYTVFFQSRLGKHPWIKPYAEDEIMRLAKEGKKKILIFSPAFVSDCLETTIEVGVEFKELFMEHGGEKWQLVESLNSNDIWVEGVEKMVRERT